MEISVRVPATTANLGPGYDAMGLSFNLYNDFTFSKRKSKNNYQNNMIYQAFSKVFEEDRTPVPEIDIHVEGEIPIARGLGSSASCIIGGLMGANYFLDKRYSKDQLLAWASELEGHPDNVAPALLGGLVISAEEEQRIYYYQTEVSSQLSYYVIVPDFELKTSLARSVVPKEIPLADAVYNISRSNLVSRALERGDMDLLRGVASDRLHEPYRKPLISGFEIFENIASKHRGVCFISGAGPTILIIGEQHNQSLYEALQNHKITRHQYDILTVLPGKGAFYL
ncbi:MAG: homoserine kinase [Tissierellia bacterium]|nr:homoserine kinase [Tissierellia bacterium]